LRSTADLKGTFKGKKLPSQVFATELLVKRDGKWVERFYQVTTLRGEDEDRVLSEGDCVLIPAHCPHRVTWTQARPPTIWLAFHFRRE
jgi:hypothetical protein